MMISGEQLARRTTRGAFLRAGIGAVGGVIGAVSLAACGGTRGDAGSSAPNAKPARPVEVEYWSTLAMTHPEGKGRYEALKLSEAANAEYVKVKYEQDGGTNWDKITAALTAGTPPNFVVFRPNNAASLADINAAADIEAHLKVLPEWAKVRPSLPASYLEGSTWRGKQVSLPLYTVNQAFVYSPDHLEKAGVVPPKDTWTWNDFESIAKRAARPPDVWGLDVIWQRSGWQLFAGSNGARFFNKEQTKVTYVQPESQSAVEFMSKLTHGLGLVPPEPLGELLAKGQTVFEPQGPYRMPVLRQAGVRFEPILAPRGPLKPTPYNWASMYSFIVFKSDDPAKERAATRAALGCLADGPQAEMCKIHLGVPVTKAAQQAPAYQQYLAQDKQMKGFAEMMSQVEIMPAIPSLERIWSVQNAAMTKVYKREMDVKNALMEAEREAQRLLDEDLARKR
jgi:ABC-type glycerol-3-phosphate transport system substrate-binding protein